MGKPKQVQPQQVDPLRPEFRGLSSDLGSYARSLVGKEATPYGGNFTAPMTAGETNILSAINKLALPAGGDGMNVQPFNNLAFGDQRSSLISDILSGRRLSPDSNPYLGANIDALKRYSNEGLGTNLNLLDAVFGRAGIGGSGRSEQAIEATRRASGDLSSQIASILGANYQQGLNEQTNVLSNVLPGMDAFTSNLLFSALGANALPRQIQQQENAAQYQEFLRRLQEPMGYTQLASQILASQPGFQYAQPSYAPMPFWQQALLGGITGAAGGYASTLGA